MESSICLDTDILVDFLRNKKEVVEWFAQVDEKDELCTTVINAFEIYIGAYLSSNRQENIKSVEDLLSRLRILNLSLEKAKDSANQFVILSKEGIPLELKDLLIGVTAMLDNCVLKTNNKKHFSRIKGLKLM